MPKFKFVDFSCNLLQIANFTEGKDGHLIIYPTQNNANLAQAYSQNRWKFENILFLAIENFIEMVLPSTHILLADDKRVIALYQLLTDEEKVFFKITDFFDFIKLANKIFTLFEELAVELVDFSAVCQLLEDANSTLFPWQIDYYEKIYNLLLRYQVWLGKNDLNDKIFINQAANIDISHFADYSQVIIVNQFYYTALERALITKLEENNQAVLLVYQLPEEFVDKVSFNAQAFNYADLRKFTKNEPHLELIIDRNKFTMLNSLCRLISETKITQIIDRDFYESPYTKLLSPEHFELKQNTEMVNTGLYHFLELIKLLLESLEFFNNQYYLPLHTLIRAFHNDDFRHYFQIENSADLLEEFYDIRDKGILYCDSKGAVGKKTISEALKLSIRKVFSFIEVLRGIRSIDGLIALFDKEEGILLDSLCSAEELKFSNIKEVVYTELANLKTFSYYNLITKWSDLSAKAEHIIIYRLFCDGLKSKTLKYTLLESKSKIRVNSLLDTRNNSYESLIFLNLVEGILPTKRSTQFLFNEKQREILTLKCYEEIRLREKYYFQRLVLSAKQCYFLGIENTEEDISLSSFLEELAIVKPARDLWQTDTGYGDLFDSCEESTFPQVGDDFWSVQLKAPELAHGTNLIKLSYTRMKSLIENPLYYLIHDWAKVPARKIITDPTLDYRFVGIFAQDYVNHIIARIKETFLNEEVFYKFQFMNKARLSEIYESFLLRYTDKDYYIPHNYSYNFLNKILKSALVEGMENFFQIVMHFNLDLSEKQIKLIPEAGFFSGKKQNYKSFISEAENNYGLAVAVTGDADLRIENQENDSKVVIDFKTGKYSKEQLALYQYIYYWDAIELGKKVGSGIYQILKQVWETPSKQPEVTISKLKEKINEIFNEIALSGFSLPNSATNAKKYDKITRADLRIGR